MDVIRATEKKNIKIGSKYEWKEQTKPASVRRLYCHAVKI